MRLEIPEELQELVERAVEREENELREREQRIAATIGGEGERYRARRAQRKARP